MMKYFWTCIYLFLNGYLWRLVVHKLNITLANQTWSTSSRLGNHSIKGTMICGFYVRQITIYQTLFQKKITDTMLMCN